MDRIIWWQHYNRLDMLAKHGDVIFDSDRLLIPVRQYFHLFNIAAFDEYVLVAYSFLKAQSEMFTPKCNVVLNANRITSDFRISLVYDRDTFEGIACPLHFEAFKDNGNFIESEALLSQINERFHLSNSYITDGSKEGKWWIEQYCRHIMYYASPYYPFQVRKFAADWMRDIDKFTDKDYNEYFNIVHHLEMRQNLLEAN